MSLSDLVELRRTFFDAKTWLTPERRIRWSRVTLLLIVPAVFWTSLAWLLFG